jgi:hypothetical protein
MGALGAQLRMLKAQILEFDRMITAWHRSNEASRRLDYIPGVGPELATALIASIADPKAFRSGRDSQPGSGSSRSRTRVEVKTGSAISASEAIATCAAYSQPARSPSSAMPKSMAPRIDLGSRRCWRDDRRRSRHRLYVARKPRHHDEWDPPIAPYDPYGPGSKVSTDTDFVSADDAA